MELHRVLPVLGVGWANQMAVLAMRLEAQVAAGDRKRILVVEDEFLIRMMLCDELREMGYQVVEASDADEALAVIGALAPHLIISDVRMPGSIDGMGLLAVVRENFPTLPVVVASGHYQPIRDLADSATWFVGKPYTFSVMIQVVESLIGEAL